LGSFMRKFILFLCISLSWGAAQNSRAQEVGEIAIGVKGGANISSLGGNDSQIGSAKVGFHAGFYFAARITDNVALQPEFIFSQQGFRVTDNFALQASSFNYNYMNLPIIAKIYVADGTSVQLGPQFGYLLSAPEVGTDNVKKFDLSLAMGLGYELPSGLNFAARYNLGLTNTVANANNLISSTTNRVFQLSIGYTFGLTP